MVNASDDDEKMPALQALTETVQDEISGANDALIVHGSNSSNNETKKLSNVDTAQ